MSLTITEEMYESCPSLVSPSDEKMLSLLPRLEALGSRRISCHLHWALVLTGLSFPKNIWIRNGVLGKLSKIRWCELLILTEPGSEAYARDWLDASKNMRFFSHHDERPDISAVSRQALGMFTV